MLLEIIIVGPLYHHFEHRYSKDMCNVNYSKLQIV